MPKEVSSVNGSFTFPSSIDVNPTAKCNLDCPFCWGPEHSIPDTLNTDEWESIIDFFADHGTSAVVFTGGEPLVRKDIGDLLQHARQRSLNVTLSTNTLLLRRKCAEVLPYTDQLGIPIDGSTREKHNEMRVGNPQSFATALSALDFVHNEFPNIEVTVRTVVSRINQNDILAIGHLLERRSHTFYRWKLYQFTPVSIGARNQERLLMPDDNFRELTQSVQEAFPRLNIAVHSTRQRVRRYVFIGPEGNIFGVGENGDYVTVGNILNNPHNTILQRISSLIDADQNMQHGLRKELGKSIRPLYF